MKQIFVLLFERNKLNNFSCGNVFKVKVQAYFQTLPTANICFYTWIIAQYKYSH